MKTILMTTAAFVAFAGAAFADGWDDRKRADLETGTTAVLNGALDIEGEIELEEITGDVTVEVTDQIDTISGIVSARSTNEITQTNSADVTAKTLVGINAANRSADVTAAAIGNTISIVTGVTQ